MYSDALPLAVRDRRSISSKDLDQGRFDWVMEICQDH